MSEALTRRDLIDLQLKAAGWDVSDHTQVTTELDIQVGTTMVSEPSEKYGRHQFADYALLARNGEVLAVVEAKKTSLDAQKGQEQAKQYCQNIQRQRGCELPF